MIVSKCPLRVSLVGGSTDLVSYLNEYETGSVISFPINLYTYIMMDWSKDGDYVIHYSKYERTKNKDNIKNDIAREVIKYFNLKPITVSFNADIPSTGSGLASSTSYLISMIKAVDLLMSFNFSQYEICKIAVEIEKKFNTNVGYQDAYGCGLPSLKRINFHKSRNINIIPLMQHAFSNIHLSLIDTNIRRKSNGILSSINPHKSFLLMEHVNKMEEKINKNDSGIEISKHITAGWKIKKKTSDKIFVNEIIELESKLDTHPNVFGYKLLGAGAGGYFLACHYGERLGLGNKIIIEIDNIGVNGWEI